MCIIDNFVESHSDIKQIKDELHRVLYVCPDGITEVVIIELKKNPLSVTPFTTLVYEYCCGRLEYTATDKRPEILDFYYRKYANSKYLELKTF